MSDRLQRRKQLGAWYTPEALVDHVLDHVLAPLLTTWPADRPVSVIDPACGDGRFLVAAAQRIHASGRRAAVVGVDIDRAAVTASRAALAGLGPDARVVHGDALARSFDEQSFDLVLGNPPFLSPLAAAHGVRMLDRAGGPYADAAVEFLALALRLVRPGGRIGLVLPLSIVAARDAAPVRDTVERIAPLEWFWFAPRPVFDAEVRTCAVGLVAGGHPTEIRRTHGKRFVTREPIVPSTTGGAPWAWLLADQLGVPVLPELRTAGVLADRAGCGADFRDEYYGLAGAVEEDDGLDRPRLVTSGLIDAGQCRWGTRSTTFHKRSFEAPVVHTDRLAGPMAAWVAQRLVPKVVVASQTRVIEAVADPTGQWLPSVPVVTVTPHEPDALWPIAAMLTGPVPSAWLAARASGSGLSAHAVRVSAPTLGNAPWPAGSLRRAVQALQRGDVERCARLATAAYGIGDEAAEPLIQWWLNAAKVQPATTPRGPR